MRLPDPDAVAAAEASLTTAAPVGPAPDSAEQLALDMRVEPLELEVAYDLVELVDPASGGDLLDRVKALRRKMALDLGIVLPLVRTRDNLDLPPHTYAVRVHGVEVGRGEAPTGAVLAIGDDLSVLPGIVTREPVFGLPAKWVPTELQQQAELMGCTVVDRASVITTHLAEVVRTHASRLLGREDVKVLVDMVRAGAPTVVEELTPALLTLGEIQRVLQSPARRGGLGARPRAHLRGAVRAGPHLQGPRAARRGGPRRPRAGHLDGLRHRRPPAGAHLRAAGRARHARGAAAR